MAKKKNEEDVDALMLEGAKEAVALAKENGITLDYSDASIKDVEKLPAECRREYKKAKSEEGYVGLALMFGGYIGEVIKKKGLGGRWERNHADWGEDSFPFYWQEHTLFLYGWCVKRIFDGSGDNVELKYKALVLDKLKEKT